MFHPRRNRLALSSLVALSLLGALASPAAASHPVTPLNLVQINGDASALCVGCTAKTNTVQITADSDAATCGGTYTLEIEVRLIGQNFAGTPNYFSASYSKAACSQTPYSYTTVAGLAAGSYKWQVRENVNGSVSGWATYNAGLTAFVIGSPAQITVAPGSINFGNQPVGSSSGVQNVTLTSSGMAPLTIKSLAVTGPFAISAPNVPFAIAAGASQAVAVTFNPVALGNAAGTLTIGSDANNTPNATVTLSGVGTSGQASLAPAMYDFGSAPTGLTTSPVTITLTNSGLAPLQVNSITTAAPYGLVNLPVLPLTLQPAAKVTFQATFTPLQIGTVPGTITVTSNDPKGPATVALVGTGISPGLIAQPNPLAFGAVPVVGGGLGNGATRVLSLTSNLPQPITIQSITLMPRAPEWSIDNLPVLPLTVGALGSVPLLVTVKPQAHGARTAQLVVQSSAPNSPLTVSLTATGVGPQIAALPNPLDFGPISVGQSGLATLSVSNQGETPMRVSTLTFSGANAADFGALTAVPFTVAAGASTTAVLRFTPGAAGARNAKVTLVSDDQLQPTFDVTLKGTGANGQIAVAPPVLDFGSIAVGAQSSPLPLSLTNNGNGPLSVTAVNLGGADAASFQVGPPALPIVIPPGGTRTISPIFAPLNVGPANARISLSTDDPMAPVVDVVLRGSGLGAMVAIDPPSVDFGSLLVGRMSPRRDVMVKNNGSAPLTLSALSVGGAQGGSFSLVNPPALPATIAPGAAQAVGVLFAPAAAGALAASLVVVTDDAKSPLAMVALSGNGVSQYLSATPLSIDFGAIRAGGQSAPQKLTIQDIGPESVTLLDGTLSGAGAGSFRVESTAGVLMPQDQKAVNVTFAPAASGDFTALLTVRAADPGLPSLLIKLLGKGAASRLSVSPGALDFGKAAVGQGAQKSVTVTNISAQPLTVARAATTDPRFTVASGDNRMLLQPGEKTVYTVTFSPAAEGGAEGRLELYLDGVFSPEAIVTLAGTGVASLSPDGGSGIDQPASGCGCVVGGTSEGRSPGAALLVAGLLGGALVRRRARRAPGRGSVVASRGSVAASIVALGLLGWGGVAQALPKVAILAASSSASDLQSRLQGTGAFQLVDVINVSQSTPTVQALSAYDVVAVFSQQAFQSPSALGDNLATFFESGGGVVLFDWGALEQGGAGSLAGRWVQSYSLMNQQAPGAVSVAPVTMGGIVESAGLVAGVGSFACRGTCHHLTTQPKPGAAVALKWSDGSPLVIRGAFNGRNVVELNFLPVSTAVVGGEWDPATDGALLIRNALLYVQPQALRPSKSALGFVDTPVGQAQSQTLSLTNTSNAPVTVSAVTVTGTNTGDFQAFPLATLPRQVAPGASLDVAVAFVPAVAGARSATVSATVSGSPVTVDVSLTGLGLAPSLTLTPPLVSFGGTAVGMKVQRTFSLRNDSGNAVILTSVSVTQNNAEFAVMSNIALPASIPAGASLTFTGTFTPAQAGVRFGTASIAPQVGSPITVPLTGSVGTPSIDPGGGIIFTSTHVGSLSDTQNITITNKGLADLHVASIVAGGPAPGDFLLKLPAFPLVIPAGGSATYQVAFRPMVAGPRSALVTVVNDDPNNSAATVALAGTGVAFNQSVSPGTLDFGLAPINKSTPPQQALITNKSSAPLLVKKVLLAGPAAQLFTLTQAPPVNTVLAAGASIGAQVTFRPTLPAAASALLLFQIDDPDSPTLAVTLKGLGTSGSLGVAPLSIDFGGVPTGKSSAAKLITVTNNGGAPLTLTAIDFSGADAASFSAPDKPNLPLEVAPGGMVQWNAVYAPPGHLKSSAQLVVTSSDPLAPTTSIALAGAGTEPSLRIEAQPTIDFGVAPLGAATQPASVVLRNNGDEKLTLSTVELTGAGAAAFKLDAPPTPLSIDPDGTVTLSLTFSPPAAGPAKASLSVASLDPRVMPQTIALTGSGAATVLGLSPASVDFGFVTLGTTSDAQRVTLTNMSPGPLTLGPIVSSASYFTVESSGTSPVVPVGGSATFDVRFAPPSTDPVSGKVTITLANVPGKVVATLELSGQGAPPTNTGGQMRGGTSGCAVGGRATSSDGISLLALLTALALAGRRRRAG